MPTTPVQPEQPLVDTAQPNTDAAQSAVDPNPTTNAEMIFMMACYCYVHANQLGYAALKELRPELAVLKSLGNPEIAQNSAATTEEIEATEKNVAVESSEGQKAPDIMDEREPVAPGESSDNTSKP